MSSSTFLSPTLRERYGRPGTTRLRFLKDCIRVQPAVDHYVSGVRLGGYKVVTPEAGYNHYLRSALVRELTRDRDLPADFAADAYEWLSDCEVTRSTRAGEPDWYYAMLVDHWYEGGLSAFIADKDAYYLPGRGSVGSLPYSAQF